MAEKKRQHYVPRFYLKNFSIDGQGKAIGTYNLNSKKFVPSASLKTQAYKNYFYGEDGLMENNLSILEAYSATVIKNILQNNTLPSSKSHDHIKLLTFTVFLKSRTLYSAKEHQEMVEKSIKTIYSKNSRLKNHLNNFRIVVNSPTRLALSSVAQCLPIAYDLDYKLLINQTDISFITSDNPVIYYNQFMELKKAFASGTGLACKGLEIFLPLSPRHYIIFFDRDIYKVGSKKDISVKITHQKDVTSLNELQCMSAHENLYFNQNVSQCEIMKLMQKAERYRRETKVNVDEYIGPTDEEGTHILIRTHRTEIKCRPELGFIKILKKAKHYELGNRVLHVRNEQNYQIFEEFQGLVDQGHYKISDFPVFLKQQKLRIESIKQ
jgi:hypothetical protein